MGTIQQTPAYTLDSGAGTREVWWLGGRLAIKLGGESVEGRASQVEVSDPRGTATPLHIHHQEDETFFVVSGEITAYVGDERFDLSAGEFAFMPKGVPHAYVVRSEKARAFVSFSPAGFEEFFLELGVPVEPGVPEPAPVIPDPEEFARRLAPYGVEIVGPPPTL